MTEYDEFVEKYCDGNTPTAAQEAAIRSWLDYPDGHLIWLSGRGGGKSTCLKWLAKAADDAHLLPRFDNMNLPKA